MKPRTFLSLHHQWRAAQMRTIAEMDATVIQELLRFAPEELRSFLENQCHLETLLRDCQSSLDFPRGLYWLDHQTFMREMQVLAKAWAGIVEVTFKSDPSWVDCTIQFKMV